MPRLVFMKILLCLFFSLSLGMSHTIDQVYMELFPKDRSFKGLLYVDAAYCLPEYRGDEEKEAPGADWLINLSEKEHERLRKEAENYLQEALQFMQDEKEVSYKVSFPDYASDPYEFYDSLIKAPILRVEVAGAYLPAGGSLQARWNDLFDANLLVELIWEEKGKEEGVTRTISPGDAIDLGVQIPAFWNEIPAEGEEITEGEGVRIEKRGWWEFVKVGFDHIIPLGRDHIVFVVGVFLFSPQWRPLLHQTLTFTVAHSVTLALSLLGVITIKDMKWVEILIALSIVYIAVENIIGGKMGMRRIILVFLFGLLHGLGFGAVLGEYLPRERVVMPLVGFNVGVEIGQIVVLIGCFLLLGWFKKSFRWICIIGSLMIGLVGAYWVMERLMG